MRVAILISGIARHVGEGYEKFYKPLIDKYNPDVYIFTWSDYNFHEIFEYYNPKRITIASPIDFSEYDFPVLNNMYVDNYGGGSFLPMIYGWQMVWEMIDKKYDCIIRSRFDMESNEIIDIDKLDLTKLNVSEHHWSGSKILDDNILISNYDNSNKLLTNIFDDITKWKSMERINEHNFTKYVEKIGLYNVVKKDDIKFKLIR